MNEYRTIPLRTEVAASLRKAILSGEYHSGQELSLTDVAESMGVSRTPVREAFQLLEGEGLITLRMNKGAIVNTIDRKFITDHYEMRKLLEGEAAFRAAQNRMDAAALLEECQVMRQNLLGGISDGYEELNQRIHTAIWTAAGNEKLYNTLINLWNGPSIGRYTNTIDHQFLSNAEHIDTLDYIQHRDAQMARRVMERHIERSMENILRSHRPDPQDTNGTQDSRDPATPERLGRILHYIDGHLREQSLCAQSVADHLGISVSGVSREIKKHTGVGFLEYVHGKRIELAKELLCRREESIKHIAAQVGYSSSLAFTRAFRKIEHQTPGSYRAQAKKEGEV